MMGTNENEKKNRNITKKRAEKKIIDNRVKSAKHPTLKVV